MSGVFPSKEFVSMKQGNEFKVKKHLDQGILSRKFFRENLLRPRILTTFVAEELFEVMDFRHLIVTCLFSMLRLSFETQKIKKNYAILIKKSSKRHH